MKSLFAVAALALLLQGCSYAVIRPVESPVRLQPPPGAPLRASLLFSTASGSNALVESTLRGSRYFTAVEAATGATTDVEIVFDGNECGSRQDSVLVGSPLAMITAPVLGAIGIATLFSVPLTHSGQWDCERRFRYRLLRGRDGEGVAQSLSHGYRYTEYKATFGYPLFTSKRREAYQMERSVDDAVAALFNRISADVAARETWQ